MVNWADIDNRPMDFSNSSLPPKLLTLTEAHIKDDNETFRRQTQNSQNSKRATLKGKQMQGHLFWGPSNNTSGLRDFVLTRADNLRHCVCVILEHQGQRLYSSFQDRFHFWEYYSSYKGTRCFYWINRSFKRKQETALLHFNIEWYSPTTDLNANKIDMICNTIQTAIARKVPLIKENLSRQLPEDEWKNSWHIYADVTMMHNAEGCMKDFVWEQVWERLKHRKDMWCATRTKPLVNMDIYTKDWAFKVVGSIKWCDRAYHQLSMPSKELFLATRMADRTGSPSFTNTGPNSTPLWKKWEDMMLTAKSIGIFRHPRTILQKTARKLSIIATEKRDD